MGIKLGGLVFDGSQKRSSLLHLGGTWANPLTGPYPCSILPLIVEIKLVRFVVDDKEKHASLRHNEVS
jgi:hypothetical protein